MKALILNSGIGSRMGSLTASQPKCMTALNSRETILSRQLDQLAAAGITDIVMTTGAHGDALREYCGKWADRLSIAFVHNPVFDKTNYIYSMYLARELLDDDIILMHGDLVFEETVLDDVMSGERSCMAVSLGAPLPEKDFKAVIHGGLIEKVGIEFFEDAAAAQPLYKLRREDMADWLEKIAEFCESGDDSKRRCYAENALNEITGNQLVPLDAGRRLCSEVDDPEDLKRVSGELEKLYDRIVYMSFSTDIIHSGHIRLIKRAARLGKLILGVLTDEAVASYRRLPMVPFSERRAMAESISGVYMAVEQDSLSYAENLRKYRPDIVVHGDNWQDGLQKPVRSEVLDILAEQGGRLVEYPYARDRKFWELDRRAQAEAGTPDMRRGSLRRLLEIKPLVTALEAHSGLTGLIAEKTVVIEDGRARQFDAMWSSSLCDSSARGKPDIGIVDLSARLRTIDEIMEVTAKPVIFDGDNGGLAEHFAYTVRTLERVGVSMIIIEDKTGLKRNSLFGTGAGQMQAPAEEFCEKIRTGVKARKTADMMICARIESLILEAGMEDALNRAFAYVEAGADAIMIHSRREEPDEIFEFAARFREKDRRTYLVVVPTSFSSVTEEEFRDRGINIVIYANQLTRAGVPAMQKAARTILENHRAQECDELCMPFSEVIRMIPEDPVQEDI